VRFFLIIALFSVSSALISQNSFARAKYFFAKNDIEPALAALDSCADQKEYADSALYLKAYLNVRNNHLEEAQAFCNQLQKNNKDYYEVWFVKGLLSSMKGKHALAAEQFTKVLNHDPSHLKALYNRALCKGMLEDGTGAIEDLNKCLEIDPNYVNAYYSRAYWLETTQQYDASVQDYEKLLTLDQNHKEAYLGLAYVLNKKGDKAKACETLQKAIEIGVTLANDLKDNFCK
jgi:tetratricopeptide (TPR) repeat protein